VRRLPPQAGLADKGCVVVGVVSCCVLKEVKPLKRYLQENHASLLKEFEGLNLHQYVAELVTHICEAPLRRQVVSMS
jgi:hypothetical protein